MFKTCSKKLSTRTTLTLKIAPLFPEFIGHASSMHKGIKMQQNKSNLDSK
jgi:hypothetical protein